MQKCLDCSDGRFTGKTGQHDIAWTLLLAVTMTVPMVAVMLFRRHSRRSAAESR